MVTSRGANRTWHKRHLCDDRKALGETEGVTGWGGVAHILFYFKRRYLIYGEEKKRTIISGTGLNTQS